MIRSKRMLRIWCNQGFSADAQELLESGTRGHELIVATNAKGSNLDLPDHDPLVRECDVAFGQPDPGDIIASLRLKLIHLSSAGYTRYDRQDVRAAIRDRGAALTTSSSVYGDPCAQHVLAMMLEVVRRLPQSLGAQWHRDWRYDKLRPEVRVLSGQSVLIVGLGSIGLRLVQLLRPFDMQIMGIRRRVRGDEPVPTATIDRIEQFLPEADHVVDLLPSGPGTGDFFNSDRLQRCKPGAVFYNVGRGDTVDQHALIDSLVCGRLGAACLDVTTPEPLPPDHPLWTAPNCFITPHIAGGHQAEHRRLVEHFLSNLARYAEGQPLLDRII
jgi:phosphoglycerate dehydrogenase-like enzyme